MPTLSPLPKMLLLALAILPLKACATPSSVNPNGALKAFKPINGSDLDTCETQVQVAEHNSRYMSIKKGKPVVYKAPCALEKKMS